MNHYQPSFITTILSHHKSSYSHYTKPSFITDSSPSFNHHRNASQATPHRPIPPLPSGRAQSASFQGPVVAGVAISLAQTATPRSNEQLSRCVDPGNPGRLVKQSSPKFTRRAISGEIWGAVNTSEIWAVKSGEIWCLAANGGGIQWLIAVHGGKSDA